MNETNIEIGLEGNLADELLPLIGKVNETRLGKYEPETLLLTDIKVNGSMYEQQMYYSTIAHFSYRIVGDSRGRYRLSWNKHFNPITNERIDFDKPAYETYDFAKLCEEKEIKEAIN